MKLQRCYVRRKYLPVLTVLSGLLVLLLLCKYSGPRSNILNTFKVSFPRHTEKFDLKTVKPKKILYWTSFWSFRHFFETGHNPFLQAKCKVSNCFATNSKDEVAEADAVIFHIPNFKNYDHIPAIRLPHQLYAFFARESPVHRHMNDLERFNNFFNISITYSRTADVGFPYGRIEKRGNVPYKQYNNDILQNKTKFALAVISHCETNSKRENVIKALKNYIQIDVLGSCNKSKRPTRDCEKTYETFCMSEIISQYRFYLSFEKSLCKDYASEKLYKVLNLPVIPVVYGGSNYSELLPPNSFIDVRDFKTAASLGAYLKEVASNTDRFLSYFTWRSEFRQTVDIQQIHGKFVKLDPRVMCDLCEYLHVNSNKTKVISDISAVFGPEKYCFSPKNWLETFVAKH